MSENQFVEAVRRHDYFTENGALSHSTSGDELLDYFAKCGTYRGRDESEVFADIGRIWERSPLMTVMIVFYLRMITRASRGFFQSDTVQKGQGARDEFRKALRWLALYKPDAVNPNLWLLPVIGVWKDLWHADLIDALDRERVYDLVRRGTRDDFNRSLVAKYLPRLRSSSRIYNDRHRALNDWAHGLRRFLGWTEKEYRRFKSAPEHRAHQFQRDMCAGFWDRIDFQRVPGRALFQLVAHTGTDGKTVLERHGQIERYMQWLRDQPVAKFSGYVYELFRAANRQRLTPAQKLTYDRQFDGLIELAQRDRGGIQGNVWVAVDTSGSMTWQNFGGVTAYDICAGLGIYFSRLNAGAFRDHVVAFSGHSRVVKLSGSFTAKAGQIRRINAMGSTNFQSVIDEIVRVRRTHPEVPVADFPRTLLVISDMQFDPTGNANTNYEEARRKLEAVGLPAMKVVWWWVTGRRDDFPATSVDEGVTMIGGFDGAVVSLILGGETEKGDGASGRTANAFENMLKALDQELLRQIQL